jgi:hypothetical protein
MYWGSGCARTNIAIELGVDFRSLLVSDLYEFRHHLSVRLHLHSLGQLDIYVVARGSDRCSGPGCQRQGVSCGSTTVPQRHGATGVVANQVLVRSCFL